MYRIKRVAIGLLFAFICLSSKSQTQLSLFEKMCIEMGPQSIPLVNIIISVDSLSNNSFVDGRIVIADYYKRTDSSFNRVEFLCQIRYRGASAYNKDKKSFAIKLINSNGDKLNANVLGIRQENSLILDAMAIDRIRMRNRICFDIWNEISRTPYETSYNNRNGTKGCFCGIVYKWGLRRVVLPVG